ncbi:MAG: rubrerythrin family protein [Deltaproteobacteria bacterium]|nr:rubrerythrin family protein [Deltaproteobacteria bacterium]
MALTGSQTEKNLQEAFAGESQANRKYLAFARKAEQEGFKQAAKLFRAAAEAETVHAHAHLRVLGGIKSTKENLKEAIAGETHEFKKMYPEMLAKAKDEGQKQAEISFDYANQVEKIHAALYENALANLGKNKETDYYVCPVCGLTAEGKAPDTCPICKTLGSKFIKIS